MEHLSLAMFRRLKLLASMETAESVVFHVKDSIVSISRNTSIFNVLVTVSTLLHTPPSATTTPRVLTAIEPCFSAMSVQG